MNMKEQLRPATRAIHSGGQVDPATGAVVPPVHFASTFRQPAAGEWGQYDYSRSGNPTRTVLQDQLSAIEGAAGTLAFSTGMAAIHAVTMLLESGDHIIAGSDIYGGAYRLLHKICNRAGLSVTLVDMTDRSAIESAITPSTKLIWGETIGNPQMTVVDLAMLADVAAGRDILTAVDNTFGTPAIVRPLEHGIDIVMHSGTKYLGGHSDCLGGTLSVSNPALQERLYFVQNATGAVLDPMSCFLICRGLKTLHLRMRHQSQSAMELASRLSDHPRVTRVLYPGLDVHPGHKLAKRQFHDLYGGMVTFELDADEATTAAVCGRTNLFTLAVSLGAVESLIEQPATMSHASYDPADRATFGVTDGLIRISVGLEDIDDLWGDLEQAIAT